MLFKLNLRMFDGASSSAGDGDSSASGVTNSTAASANGNNLQNVVYGKQQNDSVNGSKPDTEDAQAKYAEYRKGEGKQFIDKDIETAIRRRFKDYDSIKKSNAKMQNVMTALATRYGIDANDTDALSKAIAEDDSYYEKAADNANMSVEQYKKMMRLEAENAELQRMRAEEANRAEFNRKYAEWSAQAESAKAVYPNLDLNGEMQNKDFFDLVNRGVDVKTAFEVIHKDEIINGAVSVTAQRTAQAVQQQTVNNIRTKGLRPNESAGSAQSGFVPKTDPSKWTKKDRQEIERRVMKGDKIYL